jgi:cell division protein ZapA (FtsZ GTPase activity inhibitor)
MTAKKAGAKPKVDLKDEINRLMTPSAAKELLCLSPTFQQFLIRWVDLRDSAMMEEVKEFVQDLYEQDNAATCKIVTDAVCSKLDEFIGNIYKKLEELETGQKKIMTTLNLMSDRMLKMEKRVYIVDSKRFKSLENRMLRIEKALDQHLKDNK